MDKEWFNDVVFKKSNGQVQSGLFKNLKLKKRSDLYSKILGIYENQLHIYIKDAISKKPNLLINIGCGDGYYGLGISKIIPEIKSILVDINEDELNNCKENCLLNNLKNIEFKNSISNNELKNLYENNNNIFFIIDAEGAEANLLEIDENFTNSNFLIECHDFIVPNITELLKNKFMFSHKIYEITDCQKTIDLEYLDLSLDQKIFFQSEGRPGIMKWLYLTN